MGSAEEKAKRSAEKKVERLKNLHTSLRNGGTFNARSKSAERFWTKKAVVRDEKEKIRGVEILKRIYGLTGWAAALADWTTRESFEVTPQAVDIATIAAEQTAWPSPAEAARVAEIRDAVRAKMQARYDAAKVTK